MGRFVLRNEQLFLLLLGILFISILFVGCLQQPVQPQPQGQEPQAVGPAIPVAIDELNLKLASYEGKRVKVSGFFGHSKWHGITDMSCLITDKQYLSSDPSYPEYSYVRLSGEFPESLEGKKVELEGVVGIGKIDYPVDKQNRVAVIIVENYSVVN